VTRSVASRTQPKLECAAKGGWSSCWRYDAGYVSQTWDVVEVLGTEAEAGGSAPSKQGFPRRQTFCENVTTACRTDCSDRRGAVAHMRKDQFAARSRSSPSFHTIMSSASASDFARNFIRQRSRLMRLPHALGRPSRSRAVAGLLAAGAASFVAPAQATTVWEGKEVAAWPDLAPPRGCSPAAVKHREA
jgi:hypothetical protein